MNLPILNMPNSTCNIPVKMTAANRYSKPNIIIKAVVTTAIEPAAPEIMIVRPPNIAVIKPMKNEPYNPIIGSIPATKVKATASGINVSTAVRPARTSFFKFA